MRTSASHRRRGVARAMLEHILSEARSRGYRLLYLETGAMSELEPARSLYLRNGFVLTGPFGDYTDDPNSVFMMRTL